MAWYAIEDLSTGFTRDYITLDELIELARDMADKKGLVCYEQTTAKELLYWLFSYENFNDVSAEDMDEASWVFKLAEKYGADTPLYRADYLTGEGEYSPAPINELEAVIATIEHDNRYRVTTPK